MVDLDKLAENRASTLNQGVEGWRTILWSREFQALSHTMSDGEIEKLLLLCQDTHELKAVIRYSHTQNATGNESMFELLEGGAAKAGLEMRAWIQSLVAPKQ